MPPYDDVYPGGEFQFDLNEAHRNAQLIEDLELAEDGTFTDVARVILESVRKLIETKQSQMTHAPIEQYWGGKDYIDPQLIGLALELETDGDNSNILYAHPVIQINVGTAADKFTSNMFSLAGKSFASAFPCKKGNDHIVVDWRMSDGVLVQQQYEGRQDSPGTTNSVVLLRKSDESIAVAPALVQLTYDFLNLSHFAEDETATLSPKIIEEKIIALRIVNNALRRTAGMEETEL